MTHIEEWLQEVLNTYNLTMKHTPKLPKKIEKGILLQILIKTSLAKRLSYAAGPFGMPTTSSVLIPHIKDKLGSKISTTIYSYLICSIIKLMKWANLVPKESRLIIDPTFDKLSDDIKIIQHKFFSDEEAEVIDQFTDNIIAQSSPSNVVNTSRYARRYAHI